MTKDFDPKETGKDLKAFREEECVGIKLVAHYFEKEERTIIRWENGDGLTHFIAEAYFKYLRRIKRIKSIR